MTATLPVAHQSQPIPVRVRLRPTMQSDLAFVLADAVRVEGGFDSLVVMSVLHSEYTERRSRSLELFG